MWIQNYALLNPLQMSAGSRGAGQLETMLYPHYTASRKIGLRRISVSISELLNLLCFSLYGRLL